MAVKEHTHCEQRELTFLTSVAKFQGGGRC